MKVRKENLSPEFLAEQREALSKALFKEFINIASLEELEGLFELNDREQSPIQENEHIPTYSTSNSKKATH